MESEEDRVILCSNTYLAFQLACASHALHIPPVLQYKLISAYISVPIVIVAEACVVACHNSQVHVLWPLLVRAFKHCSAMQVPQTLDLHCF